MNWRLANDGPKWVPVINRTELALGIPADLLARMAFQESSFRPDVIDGSHASPAGALGILQLEPAFFPAVYAPIPFTDDSVKTQIVRAGQYLMSLYHRFGTWAEALAAYNYGPGNEEKFLDHRISGLPKETVDYYTEILADVPPPPSTGVPA